MGKWIKASLVGGGVGVGILGILFGFAFFMAVKVEGWKNAGVSLSVVEKLAMQMAGTIRILWLPLVPSILGFCMMAAMAAVYFRNGR